MFLHNIRIFSVKFRRLGNSKSIAIYLARSNSTDWE